MGCTSCAAARARVVQQARSGSVVGTIKAIGSGASLMASKITGRSVVSEPTASSSQTVPQSYVRKI